MANRRRILIAAAAEADRHALSALFADPEDWECLYIRTGEEILSTVRRSGSRLAMVILDNALLDANAVAALRMIQLSPSEEVPPVVVLYPQGELLEGKIPGDIHISEVISTPIEHGVAQRRLMALLELRKYQLKDAAYQHVLTRDPLVGVLTGKSIAETVDHVLELQGRTPGLLAYINMDTMRTINEHNGYHFGDIVLIDAAKAIREALPDGVVVGRPYGDTFVAFIPNVKEATENVRLMEALREGIRHEYPNAPGGPQTITACIGAACYPQDGGNYQTLYDAAETAGGIAKKMGRNVLLFYSRTMGPIESVKTCAALASQGVDLPPEKEMFIPLMSRDGQTVIGYDFACMPVDAGECDFERLLETMLMLPENAMINRLHMDVKRFFAMVHDLEAEDIRPPMGLFTLVDTMHAEMLPLVLRESLNRYPVDPGRITVNVTHEMVVGMPQGRLEHLVADIRAMGFSVGIFNVGAVCIANACFLPGIFDRIQFAETIVRDVFNGGFAPAFVEHIIGYFVKMKTRLCFPQTLSKTSRAILAQSLEKSGDVDGCFAYYGDMLWGREAFEAHFQARAQRSGDMGDVYNGLSLHIGEERYNEIFSRSGIILFDWRPHDDSVSVTESFEAIYGPVLPGAKLLNMLGGIIHAEDYEHAKDMFLQIKHGANNMEGIVRVRRMRQGKVRYRWRRLFLIAVKKQNGIVARVYGISIDVDRERREMQDFMRKAETDPLTQVLNRGATEERIRAYLEGEGGAGQHAMLYLDIDDFKLINDRLGHVTGDRALQFLALQLQKLFRSDDVIGRMGGDEFMVFLKDIPSRENIADRAREICTSVKNAPYDWSIGTTIGIARYPQDGSTFETLYARADAALYQAKSEGKSRWAFFSEPRRVKK